MHYEIRKEPNSLDPSITMHSAYSVIDGGYIGTEVVAKMLEKRDIAPQRRAPSHNVCSIGFSERDQKWYGWSHRALYGFGVGSTVKPGDCAYTADNPEEMIDDYGNFFADISQECANQHRAECQILEDRSGIRILHAPVKLPVARSVVDLVNAMEDDAAELPVETLFEDAVSTRKCGRGSWIAATLDDAKQMAMDFAESVG